jgi:hypothetical protein
MKTFIVLAFLIMAGYGEFYFGGRAEAQTTKCYWNGSQWVCKTTKCTPGFMCYSDAQGWVLDQKRTGALLYRRAT